MLLSYRTLFSIQLLHEYYNKDLFSDCILIPTEETSAYFLGNNLLQKTIQNNLIVLIKEDSGKPFAPIDKKKIFRFYLQHTNADLFNYTNINGDIGKGNIFYLSNLSGNEVAGSLNLSAPVLDYDPSHFYLVGDFAKHITSDDIYECIQKGSGNDPLAANSAFWILRGTKRFVSSADVINQAGVFFRYSFSSPLKKFTASVKGFKLSGTNLIEYDALQIEQIFTEEVSDIFIDLSLIPFGRYKVVLQGITGTNATLDVTKLIYYDSGLNKQGVIGIVEIFNCLSTSDPYSMIDALGNITELAKYVIRFANRNAIWKYITQTTNVSAIDAVPAIPGFSFSRNSKIFTSSKPLQLKQIPDNSFVLEFSNSSPPEPVKASFPSTSVMKCEKDIDGNIKNFYTEIFINY